MEFALRIQEKFRQLRLKMAWLWVRVLTCTM